jgi:hypothetical protein
MQWPRRARAIAHNLLGAVLLGAFLFVNLPKTIRDVRREPTHFFGPFHSSNSFLQFTTGTTNSSERVISLFKSLPPSETILILVHYNDPGSQLLGQVSAYLSWPHPVQILDVANTDAVRDLAAIDSASVAAFVFCGVDPPAWLPPGWRFGDALSVVPISSEPQR